MSLVLLPTASTLPILLFQRFTHAQATISDSFMAISSALEIPGAQVAAAYTLECLDLDGCVAPGFSPAAFPRVFVAPLLRMTGTILKGCRIAKNL